MLNISNHTEQEKAQLSRLVYETEIRTARKSLLEFTRSTLPGFDCQPFHEQYYTLLNEFSLGNIPRLIITMPPQHGKSEGSTRRLPAYTLGIAPNTKVAIASYNDTFASKFNRDIQRIIDTQEYNDIFPKSTLNRSNVVTVSTNYLRNSHEFEIIGFNGGLKSVGRGGPLTGNKVDMMIMDDLYKDYAEGNSPIIRESVWDWYTSVVLTRLHNDSQQLIVFTRWHEEDLIGCLETKGLVKRVTSLDEIQDLDFGEDKWAMINYEALKTGQKTDLDQREKGEPLWPEIHSKAKLISVRGMDPEKFECLHQGNPMSSEGLLYSKFKTYTELPPIKIVKNYTDTADTGQDKLCSIVYGLPLAEADNHIYLIDMLYTSEAMEVTEPKTVALLNKNKVNDAKIESNNGGRSFARVVKEGVNTNVTWFHQSANKEARIFSNSASVCDRIVMPTDWHIKWPEFFGDVTKYKKLFKANKFDDGPDTMTGIIELETQPKMVFF